MEKPAQQFYSFASIFQWGLFCSERSESAASVFFVPRSASYYAAAVSFVLCSSPFTPLCASVVCQRGHIEFTFVQQRCFEIQPL